LKSLMFTDYGDAHPYINRETLLYGNIKFVDTLTSEYVMRG